jgi:type III pantothenate kinase
MLLAIDIGNSNSHFGLYEKSRLRLVFQFSTDHQMAESNLIKAIEAQINAENINLHDIESVYISSVVPLSNEIYHNVIIELFGYSPIFIDATIKLPIKIGYPEPSQLGSDRIANAVAGFTKFGGPLVIVDYGTAINFEVLTDNGVFVGGAIAPGPETALAGLTARAAKLFKIDIEPPNRIIARDTENAIKSGLFYGTIGQVDRIIEETLRELTVHARVISTGGLALVFAPHSKYIESVHQNLTLEGIKIIAEYQRTST